MKNRSFPFFLIMLFCMAINAQSILQKTDSITINDAVIWGGISYDGHSININCIKKINELEYEEDVVNKILPKWDDKITRTHTFTYIDGLSIMDAKLRRTRL